MKKAQGISINTIIIAAIALIVLVILIAIFTGRMGIFGQGLDNAQQVECKTETVDGEPTPSKDCPAARTMYGKYKNVETGFVCCKNVE